MSEPFTLTLFDAPAPVIATAPKSRDVDWAALEGLAFLYTATEKGNNSGIRFMMSLEDAMAWCSSSVSSGCIHGTRWAYFFTSVANFITGWCATGTRQQRAVVSIEKLYDNQEWDDRITALGLKKIPIHEFGAVLEPLGVAVTT